MILFPQKLVGFVSVGVGAIILIGCLPFWCIGFAAAVALIIIGILILRSC